MHSHILLLFHNDILKVVNVRTLARYSVSKDVPGSVLKCETVLGIKEAEPQRIDAFELWCWRRLLRESLGQQGDPIVHPKGNQP